MVGRSKLQYLAAVAAAALMAVPPISVTADGAPAQAEGWPPQAWSEGRVGELSLLEMSMILAGVHPGSPAAHALRDDLERLDDMPPVYHDVARTTLEGLTLAMWHQQRALQPLSPEERRVLLSTEPGTPLSIEQRQAGSSLDYGELQQAATALAAAGDRVTALLKEARGEPARPHLADVLSREFGVDASHTAPKTAATPEAVAELAALVGGLSARERPQAEADLAALPDPVLDALHDILLALAPLSTGAGAPRDVVDTGRAVDDARDTLRVWSALATAHRVAEALSVPELRLPDPDAALPPLRLGLRPLTDGSLPPAPALAEALRDLALAAGDTMPVSRAEDLAAPLEESLSAAEADAVAGALAATARYMRSSSLAHATPVPPSLRAEPSLLLEWAAMGEAGEVPAAGSPEAEALLDALPFLEAQAAVAAAQEAMLAALEEVAKAFGPQPASHSTCPADEVRIAPYLVIDACGHDSDWGAEDQAVLLVDAGGDDDYFGRHGGAPFEASLTGNTRASLPVSVVLDLGGSDTYDARGLDCAHGAACPDLTRVPPDAPGGARSAAATAPVGVLVDWDGDDVERTNRFLAGNRSQGYGGDGDIPAMNILANPAPMTTERAYGILFEGIGHGSLLDSTYAAGDRSQGSTVHGTGGDPDPDVAPRHGRGLLVRLVGSGSSAQGTFTAGDHSQASAWGSLDLQNLRPASFAALLNVAGRQAASHDVYTAGEYGQAAVAQNTPLVLGGAAFFADAAGPSGRSNDTYAAVRNGRGYMDVPHSTVEAVTSGSPANSAISVFLDALAPAQPDTQSMESAVPSQDDPTILIAPASSPGFSDDTYSSLMGSQGWGRNGGHFVDLGGNDNYPPLPPETEDGPQNDATWSDAGVDSGAGDDPDRDMFPSGSESLWSDFVGLWDADPDGPASPSPVPMRFLVDPAGSRSVLDGPHALVISATGDTTYLPGFSATVLLDLAGSDTYLGRVASASGVEQRVHEMPARSGRSAADAVGLSDETEAIWDFVDATVSPPAADEADPAVSDHFVSFHLDLAGDDRYESVHDRTQGFGAEGAAGILLDLQGNDLYEAPSAAQGVGLRDGIGVLVDLHDPHPDAPGETNRFWTQAPPSQGVGREGGVGVLVATGNHNDFRDGTHAPPDHSGGLSVDASDNEPPVIVTGPLQDTTVPAGLETVFSAQATDDEGDRLRFCWTLEHGIPGQEETTRCAPWTGLGGRSASIQYAWTDVPTDAQDPDAERDRTYAVRLNVTDTGGAGDSHTWNVTVTHDPPEILGVRGPGLVRPGAPAAYQVPLQRLPAQADEMQAEVSWDDGRSDLTGVAAVDWARLDLGATVQVPDAFAQEGLVADSGALAAAVDGDPATQANLVHNTLGSNKGPIDVNVQLPDEGGQGRHVRRVDLLLASTSAASPDFTLAALLANGSVRPLGQVFVVENPTVQTYTFELPDMPQVRALLLRQVVPVGTQNIHSVQLAEVRAWGPGAVHAWTSQGTYDVDYSVVDAYGARNRSTLPVTVQGTEQVEGFPLEFLDVGGLGESRGRGAVRHASLANDTAYTLRLRSDVDRAADVACIHWEGPTDPDPTCLDVPAAGEDLRLDDGSLPRHAWQVGGDYDVTLRYYPTGDTGGKPQAEASPSTVHVETALDLRAYQSVPAFQDAVDAPLLFLALGNGTPPDPSSRTWHEGIPYLAIVDAAGDDRYLGAVATPVPPPLSEGGEALNEGARPSLVVDADGNDDYLSDAPATQGFGRWGAAALLLDVRGDDRYVADGYAQGSAHGHGVGILADLGGDDLWNPTAPHDPVVRQGYASSDDAWMSRPLTIEGRRGTFQPPSATVMQGAAEEGVGVLLALGGRDAFHAHGRSQGFGAHDPDVSSFQEYLVAEPDGCKGIGEGPDVGPDVGPSGQLNLGDVACMLGFRDVRNDPTYYTPDPQMVLNGFIDRDSWCTHNMIGRRPCLPDESRDSPGSGVLQFVGQGPRYAPGLGILVRPDGAAAYHGAQDMQGATGAAGRGMLLDADGASLLSASLRAQAHAENGQAALTLGGPAVMRLGSLGQGRADGTTGEGEVEPAYAGLAVLAAPPAPVRDAQCATSCGDGEQTALDVPLASLPGPTLAWSTPPPTEPHTEDELVLQASLDPAFPAPAPAYEVAAWSQPRASGVPGACSGEAIAAPTRIEADLVADGVEVRLDLSSAADLPDGPLHPAGCTEIHVMARQVASGASSGWTALQADVDLRPPARGLALERQRIISDGSPTDFQLVVREPLAIHQRPAVEFRVLDPGGNVRDTFALDQSAVWDGQTATAVWEPPAGLIDGQYVLQARAHFLAAGPWHVLMPELILDRSVPQLQADPLPASGFWKLDRPLDVQGGVEDLAGVEEVRFRLVDSQGEVVAMDVDHKCDGNAPDDHTACADLRRLDATHQGWEARLLPTGFQGGLVTVQANAVDVLDHATGWQDVGSITLDGIAPAFAGVTTLEETLFSRGTDQVSLRIELTDAGGTGCDPGCPGIGVDAQSVFAAVIFPDEEGQRLVPLQRNQSLDDGRFGFTWHGDGEIPEGPYQLWIAVADLVGNTRVHNPGVPITVDRTLPFLTSAAVDLPAWERPDGSTGPQDALKPGDVVWVNATGQDGSGLHAARVRLEGTGREVVLHDEAPFVSHDPAVSVSHSRKVWINASDVPDGDDHVRLIVDVRDPAGNEAPQKVFEFPFHRQPPQVLDLDVQRRSDALAYTWRLDRPTNMAITLSADGEVLDGDVQDIPGEPLAHKARFAGLPSGTPYEARLVVWDGAGWQKGIERMDATLDVPLGTDLILDPLPGDASAPRSDTVHITGRVDDPVPGILTLHLDSPQGPVLDQLLLDPPASVATHPFTLAWDTTSLEASLAGAVDVVLHARLDDGSVSWDAPLPLRIDNAPPTFAPWVEGPAPVNGWHNATVLVHAGQDDDSLPIETTGALDDSEAVATDVVRVATDGIHTITFNAVDAAVPPNKHHTTTNVRVDRTLPLLEAGPDLPHPATSNTTIPLRVEATDAMSGLDAFRVRTGEAWGAWMPQPPASVDLGDGPDREQWVDVEARDIAGNVQRRSFTVTLDRLPPVLLESQWLGRTADGTGWALFLAADDILDGDAVPAGVAALRLAEPTGEPAWHPWIETDGVGAHIVLDGLHNTTEGIMVQFRDHAGNMGEAVHLPAPQALPGDPEEPVTDATVAPAPRDLIGEPTVTPAKGVAGRPYIFSALVRPLDGLPPDAVWVEVDSVRHAAEPNGPELEGGARMFQASLELGATKAGEPHTHRFVAAYGPREVATETHVGPTVVLLADDGELAGGNGEHKAPMALGPALVAVFGALWIQRRRRS